MEQALDRVDAAITGRTRLRIGVVNAAKVVNMHRDPLLREDVLSSDLILADGTSVVWAGRLLGLPVPERVAGIDLMAGILRRGAVRGYRIFCLGAAEDILEKATARMASDHPGIQVVGRHHGYFAVEKEEAVAAEIAASRPDVLFVAMTSPRKERFLARWGARLDVPVWHGVGGSFDVLAGKVRRAPLVWQRLGLEWLYRVFQEPGRLWRRYLVTNLMFCEMVLVELIKQLPRRFRAQAGAEAASRPFADTVAPDMTDDEAEQPLPAPPPPRDVDLTGRERMLSNVVSSFAGYLVMALAGFLAPRVMDRKLGQASLGVWDFGWSVVAYFSLAQLGVGSSINRYVAKYRASGDVAALRRVASSVRCINLSAALVALAMTAIATWLVPRMLSPDLAEEARTARWVVGLLGLTVATQLGTALYQGVISGCHRFDIQTAITATYGIANSLAIIAALYLGGGLFALSLTCLVVEIATEVTRAVFAYRVCPELQVRLAFADLQQIKRLLRFGIKALLGSISSLLLVQANKLIVASHLGPAALAVYSRPMALLRVTETLSNRFAFVLTPAASSLQGAGRHEDVRHLLLQAARYGVALVLPMILGLAILGDPLMLLWMGPRYKSGLVIVVLALGYLAPLALRPVSTILLGLNLHGRVALVSLTGAVVGLGLGLLNAAVLGWKLEGAALALALPLTLSNGLFVAYYACRQLGVPLKALGRAALTPVACATPFALVLIGARVFFEGRPLAAVVGGSLAGGLVLAPAYWAYLVSPGMRAKVLGHATKLLNRAGLRRG